MTSPPGHGHIVRVGRRNGLYSHKKRADQQSALLTEGCIADCRTSRLHGAHRLSWGQPVQRESQCLHQRRNGSADNILPRRGVSGMTRYHYCRFAFHHPYHSSNLFRVSRSRFPTARHRISPSSSTMAVGSLVTRYFSAV